MTLNLFQQALSYHQSGLLDEAEKIYQQLLGQSPNDPNLLHLYGILSAQKGDYKQSLDLITQALNIEPYSSTFHNSMGNVLWYLEEYAQAISHYEVSIKLQPNAPVAHNNLGNLYAKREEFEQAIHHYRSAIALKPDYADAYYNLAIVLIKMEQKEEAIENLKKALQHHTDFIEAHGQLALLLQQKEHFEEAMEHYQKRLQLEPTHTESYVNIGAILVKQGELIKAIDYFNKALESNPDSTEAHYNLGSTYLSMQKADEALMHYLRVVNQKPDADTYFNIAVIYMYKERHFDAIDYFKSALSINPNFLDAHINLGATYLKIANYELAIHHYQEALNLQPDNIEIQYLLSAITQSHAPDRAPEAFVRNLYDQYAPYFEKHLQYLAYQAHTLLYEYVAPLLKSSDLIIVDLGCGTGLCGQLFKSVAKRLIGVDISAKMLEVAEKKQIYDELIEADITSVLENMKEIDLILAADVFGYMGDLNLVFTAVKNALHHGGYFAFTVEKTQEEPFALQKTTRYAHSKKYLQNLIAQYNFNIIKHDEVQLRTQRQSPVMGYLYVLKK